MSREMLAKKSVQYRSCSNSTILSMPTEIDAARLQQSDFYLNRELSWLKFNWRVLNEARDKRIPLLERIKFLAIVSANIDEFCMKRIGGLRLQIDAGVTALTVDGRDPATQIVLCANEIKAIGIAKEEIYNDITLELNKYNIFIRDYASLDLSNKDKMRSYFIREVFPLITPQAIDISHPFPFISNLSLNIFVTLEAQDKKKIVQARIKAPIGKGIPRFVPLPAKKDSAKIEFVRLEDIMMNNLDLLFPNMEVLTCDIFRITRNANTLSDHGDAGDLVEMIKAHLSDRKFAPIVRFQFCQSMAPAQRASLAQKMGISHPACIHSVNSIIGMSDLMELANVNRKDLTREKHVGVENYALNNHTKVFDQIDASQSIILQHPYESFETSVERFVYEASIDPEVRAIKMTLYRTSTDTKLVGLLIDAAKNGKQVAVVVELTASFDENANIEWANRLEQAGIHVSYGILGIKTHCKVILVVRKEAAGLRRYAHVSTGNYHAGNAKMYSDIGLLTCDHELTNDLSELFNYLTTGCTPVRQYKQLFTAPLYIKKILISKIAREAEHARQGKRAYIIFKTNALEDPDITKALYAASQAGVKIDLIVRDICRLRPGLSNISENINVISIVGQFLEHSRIYYFHNAEADEYFIGSADLMTRNLERRVEILIPVKDKFPKSQLSWIFDSQITDFRSAWDMLPDGNYRQRQPSCDDQKHGSQDAAIIAAMMRRDPNNKNAKVAEIKGDENV